MPERSDTFATSLRRKKIPQKLNLTFFGAYNRYHIFNSYSCYVLLNVWVLVLQNLGPSEE